MNGKFKRATVHKVATMKSKRMKPVSKAGDDETTFNVENPMRGENTATDERKQATGKHSPKLAEMLKKKQVSE